MESLTEEAPAWLYLEGQSFSKGQTMQTNFQTQSKDFDAQIAKLRLEKLKHAVLEFFEANNLNWHPCTEPFSPAFAAYGLRMVGPNQGWGVKLIASHAKHDDGIDFRTEALINLGSDTFSCPQSLHAEEEGRFVSPRHQWTTSEFLREPQVRHACEPTYLAAIERTFNNMTELRRRTEIAVQSANELANFIEANDDREFSGPNYSGEVLAVYPEARVEMTIRSMSKDKALQILAILNTPD
jgi:hypothetical protein